MAEEVGDKILIGEDVGRDSGRGINVFEHCGPEIFGGMIEDQAAVEEGIGIRRGGGRRDGGGFVERGRVAQGGVGTILPGPIVRGPGIVVKVADAGVVRRYPVFPRQS